METFGVVLIVLLLIVLPATIAALLKDGRGHTPPERSEQDWSALDLPSISYTLRNY
ncbi:hypothetical protein JOE40_001583 [Arthrobacter sp. PvP102]|jgi:hypothetical protein|uniref:hypothetical protein n=1 Tax=unclassified Arthrobacter TaxID=235627 RepID=UPI00005279AB|nr:MULTISPECIES: hypothetical protein [unclassified Arthrobacter]MBP1231939.1 hypothetical protein [Arthrobacter sp. PvP103]MBP1237074.1 hypothetical protein [Arthrobacter sp. PvP102]